MTPISHAYHWVSETQRHKHVNRAKNPCIIDLTKYIDIRRKEAGSETSHYKSLFGFFKGMDSSVKISAANKLIHFENGDQSILFTEMEVKALNDGRLKSIMKRHHKHIPASNIVAKKQTDISSIIQQVLRVLPFFC